jgi:hypothetical protein
MIPTQCPQCESEQSFIPKLRNTDSGWQEEYIRCTLCRWEQVIRFTTNEIEVLRKQEILIDERIRYQTECHGYPAGKMLSMKAAIQRKQAVLLSVLYEKVYGHGSETHQDTT